MEHLCHLSGKFRIDNPYVALIIYPERLKIEIGLNQ